MKIGIIGLPQVGKKTLFELLTGEKIGEGYSGQEIKIGAARIRDSRLHLLVAWFDDVLFYFDVCWSLCGIDKWRDQIGQAFSLFQKLHPRVQTIVASTRHHSD